MINTSKHQPASSNQIPETSIQPQASSSRPFIIPIFLPHAGCPHQCVFCNQVSITGRILRAANADQIRSQIHQFLEYKNGRRKPVQISFYGGNFLGLKIDEIKLLLDLASEFISRGHVDSIRFSTRPDTITPERLDIIAAYPVETVELGVQSMDDPVLALARRGHRAADTVRAVHQLKEHKYKIGLQMMVGLPGDTEALSLISAEKMAALHPDFVRIYPTLVLKDSRLAGWYRNGTYTPLCLAEAVTQVKKQYLLFKRHNIGVIRMGLQASEELADDSTVLAGPYHPAFGHMVYSEIFWDKVVEAIESATGVKDRLSILVSPRCISKMRGLKNKNIDKLKKRYQFKFIDVVPDNSLAPEELMVR